MFRDAKPASKVLPKFCWQATTGASLPIIGKTLAHKNVSTTAIYARLNNDPVRESMEKATSAMLNAGKEKAKVVPIKKHS